jgi:hypothetical protein
MSQTCTVKGLIEKIKMLCKCQEWHSVDLVMPIHLAMKVESSMRNLHYILSPSAIIYYEILIGFTELSYNLLVVEVFKALEEKRNSILDGDTCFAQLQITIAF